MNYADKLANVLERKRKLEQLLEHPGWPIYVGMMQEQIDQLQREILFTPCAQIDSTLAQEYKKGQLEGRLSQTSLVTTAIEMFEVDIHNLRRMLDGTGTGQSDDAGNNANGGKAP